MQGDFCHSCGQKKLDPQDWSLRRAAGDYWNELSELDSKVFRTLRLLLLHPGQLTKQYLSGQRQPFVPPVKLYLAITTLFFFFGAQTEFNIEGFQRSANDQRLGNIVKRLAESKKVPYEVELEKFNEGFHKMFSIAMGIGVVVFGFFVHLLYRRTEIYYARSLVFALHFWALFFVVVFVWRLAIHFGLKAPMQVFYVVLLPFLALSLRTVWPEKVSRYLPKLFALWAGTAMIYSMSVFLGIAAQLASYGSVMRDAMRR
ncbi:hypothetical protein F183_A24830 [Bryobacterales bacterium F-183]|nr:hypothetical protein F183_A24830 [Bryobacterales bacterium F-183]